MCLAGSIGVHINIDTLPGELTAVAALFAESLSRFVVEVNPEQEEAFKARLAAAPVPDRRLGETRPASFQSDAGDQPIIHLTISATCNEWGHFACRWVSLRPNPACDNLLLRELNEPICRPVARVEGRIAIADETTGQKLVEQELIALQYGLSPEATETYPANPNGSGLSVASLSNKARNVLGLMPHPEDHIFSWQHPRRHRGEGGWSGLPLFRSGLRHA